MTDNKDEKMLDPSATPAHQAFMKESVQLLLQMSRLLVNSASNELKVDLAEASAIAMSILAASSMIYARGYPKDGQLTQFRALAEYFNRMADEVEANKEKEGGSNE